MATRKTRSLQKRSRPAPHRARKNPLDVEDARSKLPRIEVEFPRPMAGYWDGTRSGGTFTIESVGRVAAPLPTTHPGPGKDIKWGCFSLNHWFITTSGRSWRDAANIAARRLRGVKERVPGTTIKVVMP
jgi:hypothetical protein